MSSITVEPRGGDRFAIAVRGHTLFVDQPVADGGADSAPTPTELFAAGLASCVAFYAGRYLRRHGLATDGLQVRAGFAIVPGPARVGTIDIALTVPAGVPESRREALLAVASHCTVHNTLQDPPHVDIRLQDATAGGAAGSAGDGGAERAESVDA